MKKSAPFVSIIIPVYNQFEYIHDCLKAVWKQTYDNLEIIIVDDGSNSSFKKYLNSLISNKDVVLTVQSNKGAGAARNTGLSLATGEYVIFIDSDDIPLPQYCESLVGEVHGSESDIAIGTYTNFKKNKKTTATIHPYPNNQDLVEAFLFGKIPMGIPAKIFSRSFIFENDIKFPEGVLSEERHFLLQCLLFAKKISFLKESTYLRRIHQNSSVKRLNINDMKGLTNLFYMDLELLHSMNVSNKSIFACYMAHYKVLSHCFSRFGYKYDKEAQRYLRKLKNHLNYASYLLFRLLDIELAMNLRSLPFSKLFYRTLRVS